MLCDLSGPLGGVKNLQVTNPTMTSLNVKWDPADGAVRLYKVFFVPVAGGREEMVRTQRNAARRNFGKARAESDFLRRRVPQEQVPATTTDIILRNLVPDTAYSVSVLPAYPAREGKRQTESGKTRESTP